MHNPLRYRGYVYDQETGLYYLQSRYYNPEIGRFISADVFVSTGQGILGNNMFAYCGNNPVNCLDPSGDRHIWIQLFEDHNYGFLHATVQLYILAAKNLQSLLLDKEFYVPGGRVDIISLRSNEIWEIKHGGSNPVTRGSRILEAQAQVERYRQANSNLKIGGAGTFFGGFTVNYDNVSYLISYETPVDGVVLYSVKRLSKLDTNPYKVYVPKPKLAPQVHGVCFAAGVCGMAAGAFVTEFKQLQSN